MPDTMVETGNPAPNPLPPRKVTRDGLQAASSLELVSRDELEALLDQLDRGATLDAEFLATHLLLDLTNAERLLTLCQESSCQTLSETDSDSQPPGSALLTTKIGEEQFQHFLSELRQARNLTKKVTPPPPTDSRICPRNSTTPPTPFPGSARSRKSTGEAWAQSSRSTTPMPTGVLLSRRSSRSAPMMHGPFAAFSGKRGSPPD